MKKIYILPLILLFIVVVVLGFGIYKFNFTNDDIYNENGVRIDDVVKNDVIPQAPITLVDGKYCFSRYHEATKTEPYKTQEDIVINVKGEVVTGTKKGTQAGPDMTNGFWGDLNGSYKNNLLELVYSYTVEGSKGKELEIYEYKNNLLNKMFWPLTEKNHILTPDRIGEPKITSYIEKNCTDTSVPVVNKAPLPEPIACTMDAKQCPDGSYVGRTGPKCEFICP